MSISYPSYYLYIQVKLPHFYMLFILCKEHMYTYFQFIVKINVLCCKIKIKCTNKVVNILYSKTLLSVNNI